MNYKVELTPNFKKEAKRLIKKYPSLQRELIALFTSLEKDPTQGTRLGNDIYKIRLAIASKGKGKSGGARIISFARVTNEVVILLTIYNKGEQNNITDQEISELLRGYY